MFGKVIILSYKEFEKLWRKICYIINKGVESCYAFICDFVATHCAWVKADVAMNRIAPERLQKTYAPPGVQISCISKLAKALVSFVGLAEREPYDAV